MNLRSFFCIFVLLALPVSSHAEAPPTFLLKWGSHGSAPGQFNFPLGLGMDPAGNVYVADPGNARVQKFSSDGSYLAALQSVGSGPGQFQFPIDVAVDLHGNLYMLESRAPGRIIVYDASFNFVREWPHPSGAGFAMAVDPMGQYVYVTNYGGLLDKYTVDGTHVQQWQYSSALVQPQYWGFTTAPDGSIWVGDPSHWRVDHFSANGSLLTFWGDLGPGQGYFYPAPGAVALDPEGTLYVSDAWRVQHLTTSGVYLTQWGSEGGGDGQFGATPTDIVVDSNGNIFVLDTDLERVQKFKLLPTPTTKHSWGSLMRRFR